MSAASNLWPHGGFAAVDADRQAIVTSAPFRTFRNLLCILHGIDAHELLEAGVLASIGEWPRYQSDPETFFKKADDTVAARLWTLMQSKLPAYLRAKAV